MQTDESETSSNIVSSNQRREQFGKSKQLSNPSLEKVIGTEKNPSLEKVGTDKKPSLEKVGTDKKPSPDQTMTRKNEDKFPKPLVRKLSSSVSDEDTPVTGFMSK